ncbi:hypothetical protein SEA_KEELAN_105 [Gordonia phage Keelan]|nr:hypothetical protein SEA_KEELAN_105 [Gordonia phage Keelan]
MMANGEEAEQLLSFLDHPKCEVMWKKKDGTSITECGHADANCWIEFTSPVTDSKVEKYACVACGMKVSISGLLIRRQML